MIFTASRVMRHSMAIAFSALLISTAAHGVLAVDTIKWMHLETNPDNLKVWQDIAATYEKTHPDVKIQFQFLENEAFKAKLPTLLQSNDAPSMFYSWGGGVLKAQAQTGAIRDVTAAMDADGGAWRNSYGKASVDGLTFDGKVWAVPYQTGLVSFYYNKAMFQKAGVDASGIKTWDDFLAAVKKIKDAGLTPIAGGGGDKWPIHFYWSYLAMRIAGQDGFAAAKAGKDNGFANEAFVKASQDLADLGKLDPFQKGYLGATWPDTMATFADGRAAILLGFESAPKAQIAAATDGKGLAADNIGRFAFPTVAGGKGLITDDFGGLNGWVITKNAPKETEDFVKYLTNADNERIMAERIGIIPVAKGAEDGVKSPAVADAVAQMSKATWHQNYLDQDLGPNVGRVVNDMSVGIVSGQVSPQDAVQQIQDTYAQGQ
jgi:raffinose/stachyose/melibiose transport system substrate-binding protein